jgi:hypothetical protein
MLMHIKAQGFAPVVNAVPLERPFGCAHFGMQLALRFIEPETLYLSEDLRYVL